MNYKYGDLTHQIIGCAMKVHTEMGTGFQELIYQKCLALQIEKAGLICTREISQPIFFGETKIGERRIDILVEDKILIEIKAKSSLEPVHLAQAKNYLEAFGLEVGLLINFGESSLQWKRLINCPDKQSKESKKSNRGQSINPINPGSNVAPGSNVTPSLCPSPTPKTTNTLSPKDD